MENTNPPVRQASSAAQVVTILLLVVMAFLVGSLWQKVELLGGGTLGAATGSQIQGGGAPTAKYGSLDEAFKDVAKAAKADGNKLIACVNSGEKKTSVETDASYANTLGVNGTPGFFVNGRFLGGAYPYEAFKEIIDKELAGTGSNKITDYSESLQQAAGSGAFIAAPKSVDIGNSPVRGAAKAKVTIVEFSDFQCPFCERAFPTMERILKDYDGKVKLVYKHLPLGIHQYAQKAAEAAECAKDQGKFWEFHDELFKRQSDWTSV